MTHVTFDRISSKDYDTIRQFLLDHWLKKNHIFTRDKTLFDWQHLNKRDSAYTMFGAWSDSGELVAVLGSIPQSHFDPKLSSQQISLALWRKRDDCKLPRVGSSLFMHVLNAYDSDFVLAQGLTEAVKPYYRSKQFQVQDMDHVVLLNRELSAYHIASVPTHIPTVVPTGQREVIDVSLNDIERDASATLFASIPVKSPTYLRHRYYEHPTYRYALYAGYQDSKISLLLVIREVVVGEHRAGRVVDILGDTSLLKDYASGLTQLMCQKGWEFLDIMSLGVPLAHYLHSGFQSVTDYDELIIPNYYEPFVQKSVIITAAVRTDYPDYRVFRGDSDQDRPSLVTSHGNYSD